MLHIIMSWDDCLDVDDHACDIIIIVYSTSNWLSCIEILYFYVYGPTYVRCTYFMCLK